MTEAMTLSAPTDVDASSAPRGGVTTALAEWLLDMARAGSAAMTWLAAASGRERRDALTCWLRDSRCGSVAAGETVQRGWAGRPGHRRADRDEGQERKGALGCGAGGALQFHGTVTLYPAPGVNVKLLGAGVCELHVGEGAILEVVAVENDPFFAEDATDDALHQRRGSVAAGTATTGVSLET